MFMATELELKVEEVFIEDVGKGLARFDPDDAKALGASLGDVVDITGEKKTVATISGILLAPLDAGDWWPEENELGNIGKVLQGLAVISGDKVNIPLFGGKDRFFSVDGTSPSGPVIINQQTKFKVNKPDYTEAADSRLSYEAIGGLDRA